MEYIRVTKENLEKEHICCAISNNKDIQVSSKKAWLAERFDDVLVFLKSAERGKCFIEYLPAEKAWNPIDADGYTYIDCLWVSGSFKGHGYSNDLLDACIADSRIRLKKGLCILSSAKKKPFLADPKYLKALEKRLDSLKTDALPLGSQSLIESLIHRRWYNPFPKVRTIERPDAAAAELLEGRILILCDTSPRVLVLPTAIFDFLQETDDFYFPPLTGNYLRVLRHAVFWLSLFLTPLFYLATRYREILPAWLGFAIPAADATGSLPVLLQLFLVELAVDGLQLASMNTPDMLTNSLSVIGGLILGEFAVEVGWLSPHVILYMAFTAIAAFTQQNQELGYSFKFLRMLILILSGLFGYWGFFAGLLLLPVLLATNRTLNGKYSYLYPLIPWNGRALLRLLFRLPKRD